MKSALATFSKLDMPEKFARVKSLIVQIKAMDTPLAPHTYLVRRYLVIFFALPRQLDLLLQRFRYGRHFSIG